MTEKTKNGEQNKNIPYNIMNIFLEPSQIADQQQTEVIVNLPAQLAPKKKINFKKSSYKRIFGKTGQRKKILDRYKKYFTKKFNKSTNVMNIIGKIQSTKIGGYDIKALRKQKWYFNVATKEFVRRNQISKKMKKTNFIDGIFVIPKNYSQRFTVRQVNYGANTYSDFIQDKEGTLTKKAHQMFGEDWRGLDTIATDIDPVDNALYKLIIDFKKNTTNIDYIIQVAYQVMRERLKIDRDYEVVFRYSTIEGGKTTFQTLKSKRNTNLKWSAFSSFKKLQKYLLDSFDRLTLQLHRSDPDMGDGEFIEKWNLSTLLIIVRPTGGGCLNNARVRKTIVNNVFLRDYRSVKNNCLIAIFKNVNEEEFKHQRCNTIRQQLLIPSGIRLPFHTSRKLAKYFKTNIVIYEWSYDLLKEVYKTKYEYEKTIDVLFNGNHYSHIINKDYNTETIKCKFCKKKLMSCNYTKHVCNEGNITFVNRFKKDRLGKQVLKKYHPELKVVKKGVAQKKGKQAINRVIKNRKGNFKLIPKHNLVFDLETFFCPILQRSIAYAVGCFYIEENRYFVFYGENCMDDFMNWIYSKNDEDIVLNLISFNGSGFDHFFLYKWLLDMEGKKYEPEVLMNGGRLLSLRFNNNASFDIYLFLNPNSLDSCVKGFKIKEVAKGVFPHNFPKCWGDVYYIGKKRPLTDYPDKMRALLENGTYKQKPIFDFKQECLEYLRSDILATFEVYKHLKIEMSNIIGGDCRAFLTLSQMSYDYNATLLGVKDYLELPFDKIKYEFINKSIYGGRTTPIKLRFENMWIKNKIAECVNDKEINDVMYLVKEKHKEFELRIEEGEDFYKLFDEYKQYQYLMPFDVKSLYPTAYQYAYPMEDSIFFKGMEEYNKLRDDNLFKIGNTLGRIEFKSTEKRWKTCKHLFGIFQVDIDFIPNHIVPVLPQKNDNGDTCWDLICRENQYYNTIDLEEGEKRGYKFTIKSGFVYKFGKNFLQPFVNKVYAKKKCQDRYKNSTNKVEKEKYNPAFRMCLKIILNSLYGKFIQRPIFESSILINDAKELNAFYKDYSWTDFEEIGDGKILLMGLKKEFKGICKKPLQVGSFILGYSRKIMNEYMDIFDEERFGDQEKSKQNSFYYTDTDCLWVSSLYAHKLKGRIGEELGDMEDELEGGICYDSYFISPKCYCAEYFLYDEEKEKYNIKFKIRAKGHPSHCLNPQMFKDVWEQGTVKSNSFKMLKKIRHKLNLPQIAKGYKPFTIVLEETQRSINRETWKGRSKDGIMTYPIGYSLE